MPIYEYRCDEGHEVELMQSISDDPIESCPECGAPTRRVLHSPAIHFKGSGFHNTDYGTRSRGKSGDGAEGTGQGSGDTGSDKSEGKGSGDAGKAATGSGKGDSGGSGDSGSSGTAKSDD